MAKSHALLSLGLTVFRSAGRKAAAERVILRRVSLPTLLLGLGAALWGTPASAQSYTIYVEPVWIYSYIQFYSPSLSTTFANAQSQVAALSNSSVNYVAQNLHPDNASWDGPPFTYYDGIPMRYRFDLYYCYTNPVECGTTPNWEIINTGGVCPGGAGPVNYNSPSTNELLACPLTISNVQPPPKNCKSCAGNPIYAATGQKVQRETDYTGVGGLAFSRTYRSTNGYFASAITAAFVDNSSPAGTTSPGCYPAYYLYDNYRVSAYYCFPYISTYPYVNSGVAQYQLQTNDGLMIGFSGPNSAVTQAADINERVTQIVVGGVNEWQVKRDDDSTEIYNATGGLIQKTLRGLSEILCVEPD